MCCISSACPGVRELEPVCETSFCQAPAQSLDTCITVFVGLLHICERMHTQSYKLLHVEVLVLSAAAVTRPSGFKSGHGWVMHECMGERGQGRIEPQGRTGANFDDHSRMSHNLSRHKYIADHWQAERS